MIKIYTLSDPITNEIRYVGKTEKEIKKRLNQHITESKKSKCHRHFWINTIISEGLKPTIEILDIVLENNWEYWEKFWISQIKSWGYKLTNTTEGGEGGATTTGKICSEETKEKIRIKVTGYKHSDESKKLISDFRKDNSAGEKNNFYGKQHSKESKDKISLKKLGIPSWNAGKELTENHKKNLSQSHTGKKLSQDSINKRSEAVRIPVALIDLSGNIIKEFIGITQATRELGLAYDQIAKIIESGVPSKKKGYLFRYICNNPSS